MKSLSERISKLEGDPEDELLEFDGWVVRRSFLIEIRKKIVSTPSPFPICQDPSAVSDDD